MKIGIIGAGTMGMGIAQTFAQREGFEVILCSSSLQSAQKGKEKLGKGLNKRILAGKMPAEMANVILDRIKPAEKEDCRDCDMIIESMPEKLEMKKNLFREMQKICKPDCIFATNTSSLSITDIGGGILQSVIGMHFFNPAPVMKLVEIVPGLNTPKEAVEKVSVIAEQLGKTPIEVKENPGFVVNRILIPMINEAVGLYAEGVSSAEEIDSAMKLGANHPMGPLELGDLIGLDVCLAIMETLQAETGDPKYRPDPLLRKMVRGGWLGIKAGRGFYVYNNNRVDNL